MKNGRIHIWRITGILIFLLIYGSMSVSASDIPNLTGSWTLADFEQYTPANGFGNQTTDFISTEIFEQDGRVFIGSQKFFRPETSENVTELFSGALSPDGRTFEIDNEGSGISFGEVISDNECYYYTLISEKGPWILVFHLIKEGTGTSSFENVPELIGTWNLTHNRKNADSTTGLLTIDKQQDRIWVGSEQIIDEDGTTIDLPIVGTIGEGGNLYATSADGAFMFGSLTGNDTIQSAFIIPGDTDGTYVVERQLTKNGASIPQSELSYPVIAGDWKIDNRKVIENGEITDIGSVSDEWLSFSNQIGSFFTVVRHNETSEAPSEIEHSGIFRVLDEAYATGSDAPIEIYHVIDNSTIEAIVNMKDNRALLYLDVLSRKSE